MAVGTGGRLLAKFFGRTISEAAAFAAGVALGPVLGPPTQALRNTVNAAYPAVPIGPGLLAEGVAQGQIGHDTAQAMAAHSGISADNFDHMVEIARGGPGAGVAFELWRRKLIDEAGFRRAVQRLGLEQEWVDDLVRLHDVLLDPADIARAIHRGLIPDPGLLEGTLPRGEGNVPAYPVYPIDALAEAAGYGIDHDRLGVLVGLQGLPMGSHEAAQALFRGILTDDDFLRAIAEGNTRNEWAEAIRDQSRQIPTARDFLENALRGYRTLAEAIAGARLHGMSPEHATMIYQNQGRPMTVRLITQALARGGKFRPEPGEITDPYDAAIVEGNLKPAYYDLAKALRYTYPSAFALRALAQSGEITVAEAEQVLLYQGWEPTFAHKVAAAWGAGGGAAAKDQTKAELQAEFEGGFLTEPEFRAKLGELGYDAATIDEYVTLGEARLTRKYRDAGIQLTNKRYLLHDLTDQQAGVMLGEFGVSAEGVAKLLAVWRLQQQVALHDLTDAQVKRAYLKAILTRDEAVAELERHGMNPSEVATFLDE